MEHVYPAKPEALPLMKQTLAVGLEVKLERTHDISAVIHAERLIDGRVLVTAVPLLYGSYTVTRGLGTFRLEPPPSLNLVGGWPLFKSQERASIEQHLAEYRQKMAEARRRPHLHTWSERHSAACQERTGAHRTSQARCAPFHDPTTRRKQ